MTSKPTPVPSTTLSFVLTHRGDELLQDWISLQLRSAASQSGSMNEKALRVNSRDFLAAFSEAIQAGGGNDIRNENWSPVRDLLSAISASRAKEGYSPSETAIFVFSLKEPLFKQFRQEAIDLETLADEIWSATLILDQLGLFTTEAYQRTREDIISRQQRELLELSTPVIRLWENILALPLIGTLDSGRTQVVMQNLLEAIVATRSDTAIIDITGVATVDTLVAQHLLKTVAAARLMGADCIISGIRPQIAQTIIHLGVDLSEVATKATMADAFQVALERSGFSIQNQPAG